MDGVAGCHRQRKMTSTDLRRTRNAPTWTELNLLLKKELTARVYKTKRSTEWWFISSILTETKKCLHECTRASEKGGKMNWRARPTANHSHVWTNWFSTGLETTPRISRNQTKSSEFWMNEEKIMTLLRWEESNRIINTLLDGWPANMAGYFYSSSCILVRLKAGRPSNKIYALYWLLYCIALHCFVVLFCVALHCIALYCIVLRCIALHCIVLTTV